MVVQSCLPICPWRWRPWLGCGPAVSAGLAREALASTPGSQKQNRRCQLHTPLAPGHQSLGQALPSQRALGGLCSLTSERTAHTPPCRRGRAAGVTQVRSLGGSCTDCPCWETSQALICPCPPLPQAQSVWEPRNQGGLAPPGRCRLLLWLLRPSGSSWSSLAGCP